MISLRFVLVAGLMVAGTTPAAADTQRLRVVAGLAQDTTTGGGALLVSGTDNKGLSQGNAFATYGALKVFATAAGYNPGGNFFFTGINTSAYALDSMVLSGGVAGTQGVMRVALQLSGNWSGQASAGGGEMNSDFAYYLHTTSQSAIPGVLGPASDFSALHNFSIDANGIQDRSLINDSGYQNNYVAVPTIIGRHIVDIPFIFGAQLFIEQTASCAAGVRGPTAGTGGTSSCDFSHSIYWGGVQQILDGQGNTLHNWSIGSSSGFDYASASPLMPAAPVPPTAAVPEPGVWAMMIIGFGCVGGRLRRARAGQSGLASRPVAA